MSWHKENLGYLTIASNTNDVNYLDIAYLQAMSIKDTQKNNRTAVLVDDNTYKYIDNKHKKVFDYIIQTEPSSFGPFGLEPKIFRLTPFKETIKLEADIILSTSIDHWLNIFRQKDIVLSYGCKNYLNLLSDSRKYRKIFDDNLLPDVYNGLMYFRFSQTAADFFKIANLIFQNWKVIAAKLLNIRDEIPSTDVVYGITALVLGKEKCCIPTADFINFVHMKPAINNFDEDMFFTDCFITEVCNGIIRINNLNQYHPLHVYDKKFLTSNLKEYHECDR